MTPLLYNGTIQSAESHATKFKREKCLRFDFLTAVLMKTVFFWDVIPASWYIAARNYSIPVYTVTPQI